MRYVYDYPRPRRLNAILLDDTATNRSILQMQCSACQMWCNNHFMSLSWKKLHTHTQKKLWKLSLWTQINRLIFVTDSHFAVSPGWYLARTVLHCGNAIVCLERRRQSKFMLLLLPLKMKLNKRLRTVCSCFMNVAVPAASFVEMLSAPGFTLTLF